MVPPPIPQSVSRLFAVTLILSQLFSDAAPALGSGRLPRVSGLSVSLGLTCRQVCGGRVVSPPPAFCSGPWFGRPRGPCAGWGDSAQRPTGRNGGPGWEGRQLALKLVPCGSAGLTRPVVTSLVGASFPPHPSRSVPPKASFDGSEERWTGLGAGRAEVCCCRALCVLSLG